MASRLKVGIENMGFLFSGVSVSDGQSLCSALRSSFSCRS